MSQLQRLRERLAQQRQHVATHPLDDTVTITYRMPTPEDHSRARQAARGDGDERAVDRSAGMLADCLLAVAESGLTVATLAGRDLAGHVGLEWRERTEDDPGTTAADVIRALYGGAWQALLDDAVDVMQLAGRRSDPLS